MIKGLHFIFENIETFYFTTNTLIKSNLENLKRAQSDCCKNNVKISVL